MIVFTDEQSFTAVKLPIANAKGYLINVASAQHGIKMGEGWQKIDGFSESVIDWILETEKQS